MKFIYIRYPASLLAAVLLAGSPVQFPVSGTTLVCPSQGSMYPVSFYIEQSLCIIVLDNQFTFRLKYLRLNNNPLC